MIKDAMRTYLCLIVVIIVCSINSVSAVHPLTETINSPTNIQREQSQLSEYGRYKSKIFLKHQTGKSNPNKRGFISTLLGVSGLFTMFFFGNPLAVFFALVGLPLSIIGIIKDENKTLAIVGFVLNGMVLTFLLWTLYNTLTLT